MTGTGGGHVGEAPGPSTHDLLLAVAGQVDDDLLAWARELVAVGENTRAIALVTAGVSADRTALPAPLRAVLVAAARTARTDLDADAALPPAADTALGHRFAAAPSGGDERVAAAVGALPARLLDAAEVLLAWRLTPAGSAPGPLPHPVVLVDLQPGGRPADVLAYQLSVALDRSGVVAAVEVLTSGNPLSEYHAAARDAAVRIHAAAAAPPVEVAAEPPAAERDEPAAPEPTPGYADLWAAAGPYVVPVEPDAAATDPTGEVVRATTPELRPPLRAARDGAAAEPGPRPTPRLPQRRRTTVTPLTRSPLPSPVPLARRDGTRLRPLVPVTDETPVEEGPPDGGDAYSSLEHGRSPLFADPPVFRAMQDPLSGPLNAPLLAPLLDPTPADEREDDDDPFGLHGISPLAPDLPAPPHAPVEDRWASEWASGDWAVSPSDLDPPPVDRDAGPDEDEPRRHRAASGPADEPPAPAASLFTEAPAPQPSPAPQSRPRPPSPGPAPARPAAAQRPEPAREAVPEDLGLRPDSVARLSDADRELLARLQAGLGSGTRPRTSRRAGVAAPNGSAPNGNRSGRLDPPDLAG